MVKMITVSIFGHKIRESELVDSLRKSARASSELSGVKLSDIQHDRSIEAAKLFKLPSYKDFEIKGK